MASLLPAQRRQEILRAVSEHLSRLPPGKFRRILEAYQIEADYGRTLGAERAEVEGRTVDVLRIGRTEMYYLSSDGDRAGYWDAGAGKWLELQRKYFGSVKHGLKNGNKVNISGVLGNTDANGTFTVTVTDANEAPDVTTTAPPTEQELSALHALKADVIQGLKKSGPATTEGGRLTARLKGRPGRVDAPGDRTEES